MPRGWVLLQFKGIAMAEVKEVEQTNPMAESPFVDDFIEVCLYSDGSVTMACGTDDEHFIATAIKALEAKLGRDTSKLN